MTSRIIGFIVLCAAIVAIFFALQYSGARLVTDIAGSGGEDAQSQGSDLVGKTAPYFDLPDMEGNYMQISDFTDTPLVLVFWATWNDQAADQMHILDEYLTSIPQEQQLVTIITIDSQEEKSVISSFMRRGGYRVRTLIDARGAVSEAYRIKSLPTTYFIGRDGIIRDAYAGLMSERMFVDKVEKILN
ncbi:MAG: hypothetical protein A2854_00525 [Parcubacteria group bacterium RIFCSPHIGHO2_01_FULL_56_18]|nr:MAG: hypothetical protein A2854_00525 [Parcubacteria group bacterium RIFCSPHIGHO2_01_FULL_56_18]